MLKSSIGKKENKDERKNELKQVIGKVVELESRQR